MVDIIQVGACGMVVKEIPANYLYTGVVPLLVISLSQHKFCGSFELPLRKSLKDPEKMVLRSFIVLVLVILHSSIK